VRVNEALSEIVGYSKDELLAMSYPGLTHPSDRARSHELHGQLLAGERTRYHQEKRYVHRLGHSVWVSVTVTMLRDDEGEPRWAVAHIHDVTEHVRAREALRESESLLRATQEIANVGSWAWDSEHHALTWSEELYRISGLDMTTEVTYERFLDLIHPDDRPRMEAELAKAAREGGLFGFDHRIKRPDGTVRDVHCRGRGLIGPSGVPSRILGSTQDVTDLRLAEANRKRQTETLQAIFDHIPAMVTVTDAEGTPVFANGEWARISGWSIEELRSVDVFAAVYPDPEVRTGVLDFIRAATGTLGDFQMQTRDGRLLETTWACVRLSDGSVVGIAQDVTEQRRLEAQLRQGQKMEAVGRLAGGVAHDFNNLLTVIQNYGNLVADELPAGSIASSDILQVLQAGDRAAELTRQLLAFSRKQLLKPRIVDVNLNVVNVTRMLRRVIGEDILLETDLAPTVWPVLADPGQLEQVLINLAVNARDAMPDGGRLTLRTETREFDVVGARSRLGLVPGRYASIIVEDTGVGIAPDVLPQIFEPFFTTKAPGKGTGLGLATVYGIIKQSGGFVYVDTVPGRGSAFTVLLPARGEAAGKDPAVFAPPPRGTETILVVEDELPVRTVVRRMLERLGYTVREAASGAEALGILETSLKRIDLVLTDMVMPDVHGRVLAECLLERVPATRVIYMSGYTDDDIVRRGLTGLGTAFLQKPFTPATLARAVREALDGTPSPTS
jgi:PAS domain S-box-containing protein